MRRWRPALIIVSFLVVVLVPQLASADVNDFTINSFQSDETLSLADKQGELHIVEQIQPVFTTENHGIERAIPKSYKGHSLQLHITSVSSTSGAPAQYTTYSSNGNTVIRIGDPNQTVTGRQEYTIDYTLDNVITFYPDHDELYWNVNGVDWGQPIAVASMTLHLPDGLTQNKTPLCYSGGQGSTTQNCQITSQGNTITSQTTVPLQAGQTLTYVTGFKTDYFSPYTFLDNYGQYIGAVLELVVPILLLGGGSFIYWFNRGRDAKGTGIIVPQYDAPDNLSPIEVGTVVDFKVDNRDITATIIDLAIRHVIKIIEYTNKGIIGTNTGYTLELVNPDWSNLSSYEVMLMQTLFPQPAVGNQVDLTNMQNKFYNVSQVLKSTVTQDLTTAGYFRTNPGTAMKLGVPIIFIGFVLLHVVHFLAVPLIVGAVIGAVIGFLFLRASAARTEKGVAANEHILGLKLYLNVAEKDRLEKLQAPNAAYAEHSTEPVKTVDLFEKLLPYAMVLGVESAWAKQFASIYTQPPSWYGGGNWNTFSVLYLTNSLGNNFNTIAANSFAAPVSSGSSGFGGGGFSGGGGGGGGGGGW